MPSIVFMYPITEQLKVKEDDMTFWEIKPYQCERDYCTRPGYFLMGF